jgi:hypothetical protein
MKSVPKDLVNRYLPMKHQYDPLVFALLSLIAEKRSDYFLEIWKR